MSNIWLNTGVTMVSNCCVAPTSSLPAATSGLNVEENPLFVDKDNYDFHLTKDSPCANAGVNQNWMGTDLDGHHRIDRFSGVVDIGAYEYLPQGIMITVP